LFRVRIPEHLSDPPRLWAIAVPTSCATNWIF
jgi:hypothetical protein